MTTKKFHFVMLGIVATTGLLLIGAVVFGDRLLKQQSDKLMSLKLENKVIDEQKTALKQAKLDIEKYAELESTAKQIVPQEKDQVRTVREIVSLAEQANVHIESITFPSSTLGNKKSGSSNSESGSKTTTKKTEPISQVKPVSGVNGLYYLDINISSDSSRPASYARLIDFLERLEQNRRTAQVSKISVQPDNRNRNNVNFSLTVTVYIKP